MVKKELLINCLQLGFSEQTAAVLQAVELNEMKLMQLKVQHCNQHFSSTQSGGVGWGGGGCLSYHLPLLGTSAN